MDWSLGPPQQPWGGDPMEDIVTDQPMYNSMNMPGDGVDERTDRELAYGKRSRSIASSEFADAVHDRIKRLNIGHRGLQVPQLGAPEHAHAPGEAQPSAFPTPTWSPSEEEQLMGAYASINTLLGRLHTERLHRRRQAAAHMQGTYSWDEDEDDDL